MEKRDKQGLNGNEDYMSQEFEFVPLSKRLKDAGASKEAIELSDKIWNMNKGKRNEVCDFMQSEGWSYDETATHKTPEEVLYRLAQAEERNYNLLMNIGPLPDGSIHPEDYKSLLKVGEIIEKEGFPTVSKYGKAVVNNSLSMNEEMVGIV